MTNLSHFVSFLSAFQSTPSLRKVTYLPLFKGEQQDYISIHTFLAEGDHTQSKSKLTVRNFNPHLPCGRWPFALGILPSSEVISIHTFLAEGDMVKEDFQALETISIHTFLAEGDKKSILFILSTYNFNPHLPCGRWRFFCKAHATQIKFQSTPSLRKVTVIAPIAFLLILISIHTFLAEGDVT